MTSNGTIERQRRIQRQIAKADLRHDEDGGVFAPQTGARAYPVPPFGQQHQAKPGQEADLDPAPLFDAPFYRGSGKLEGSVALITGGDSGIGRSVAVLFAREGADVAIVHLGEPSDANVTRDAVRREGRQCLLIEGDIRSRAFCRSAVATTVEHYGRLDVLVNNAAFQVHAKSIEDLTEDHFDLTLKTNLYGYFFMAQAAVPHMKERGAIINTGSITGMFGSKELLDYSMTKGGIHAFTRALAAKGDPRECGGARTRLVASKSFGQGCRGHCQVRQGHADATAGATGGNRTCLCVPGLASLFELHHRRNPADRRRLWRRVRLCKERLSVLLATTALEILRRGSKSLSRLEQPMHVIGLFEVFNVRNIVPPPGFVQAWQGAGCGRPIGPGSTGFSRQSLA